MFNDVIEKLAKERAAFIDLQARTFLQKNNIPFETIEKTNKLLKEKGYRLIDEVQGGAGEDQVHTLLLVKIINQTAYTIKKMTINYE